MSTDPEKHSDTTSDAETLNVPNTTPVGDDDALIGQTVGNFRITSRLGQGAFGNVYKATDIALDRDVALKFLRNPLHPSVKALFEREAQAIAALSRHPGIVDIYHWGEFRGQNYFVLEYVDSSALRLLEEHPEGLPVPRALAIFVQCAEALAAAHAEGILHRDIKPANILIDSSSMTARVADFGLARLRQSDEFTLNGLISGSPPYMSPEQAKGDVLDARSDVFSLGVSFYEMLCGKRPFEGESIEEIMTNIRHDRRVPFRARRNDIHEGICSIIDKAIAHNPSSRFQSAAELARALRIALNSLERSGSVPDSVAMTGTRSASSIMGTNGLLVRWGLPGVAAVALLATGVFWALRPQGTETPAAPAQPAQPVTTPVSETASTAIHEIAPALTQPGFEPDPGLAAHREALPVQQTPRADSDAPAGPEAESASARQVRSVAAEPESAASLPEDGAYVVKSGDSLSAIAARYSVGSQDIMEWNHLKNANALVVGQKLYLRKPPEAETAAPASAEEEFPVEEPQAVAANEEPSAAEEEDPNIVERTKGWVGDLDLGGKVKKLDIKGKVKKLDIGGKLRKIGIGDNEGDEGEEASGEPDE